MERIEFDSKESKRFYNKLLKLRAGTKELLKTIPLKNNENLDTLRALSKVGSAVKSSIGIMNFSGFHKGLPIRLPEKEKPYKPGLLGAIKYYAGRKNTVYSRS
jgi:hypothetical protein